MPRIRVDDVQIEYAWVGPDRGAPPPLVFLHEGLGCAALWRDVPAVIAERTGHRALVYSRRGYGESDPAPLPRPVSFMHDEAHGPLPALLDALAVERPLLVGHSDGASIAIIHAATRPGDVTALVLEAPHVFVEDCSVASIARMKVLYDTTDLAARMVKYHGDNTACAFRGWNDVWLDPAFRAWNIEAYLPRITCPVLVIQGHDDEYGTVAQVHALTRQVSGPVETLMLAQCGHSPHRDQRDATTRAIVDFITRVTGGGKTENT